jgi:hypothetical protein
MPAALAVVSSQPTKNPKYSYASADNIRKVHGRVTNMVINSQLRADVRPKPEARNTMREKIATTFDGWRPYAVYPSCAFLLSLTLGSPGAIASAGYRYVITPKPNAAATAGGPVIRQVALNKRHFQSHDEIQMKVLTSSDVVKVTNHELGHGGILRKISDGVFAGSGRVTGIPFFLKRMHVDMHYTATTASGETTTVTAPVTF